jgi:hypothetical protein
MFTLIEGLPADAIGVEATGHITADDYRMVLEPAVRSLVQRSGRVRILIVFGDGFEGFGTGGAWEDVKMGTADWKAWERIAVVTSIGWMRDAIRAFGWLSPGEVKVFEPAARAEAVTWLTR